MIKGFKAILGRSDFFKNVIVLMSGTLAAQVIPVIISPILSRLYTPADFGLLALYMSICAVTSSVATGRYELAIMVPKREADAFQLMVVSILVALIVSFSTLIFSILFGSQIVEIIGNERLTLWIHFVPLSVFLLASYQTFNYWLSRNKKYKRVAANKISQSILTNLIALIMGLVNLPQIGLIVGRIFGELFAAIGLGSAVWSRDKGRLKAIEKSELLKQAKEHSKFPKFNAISALINTTTTEVPTLLLTIFFIPDAVGLFALGKRVLFLPASLLQNAIAQVFLQKTIDAKQQGKLKEFVVKLIWSEAKIAIPVSLIMVISSPVIFQIVFGEHWKTAGIYAQLLAPYFAMSFIAAPISTLGAILGHQKRMLRWSIFRLIGSTIVFIIGGYFHSVALALLTYSLFNVIAYIIILKMIINMSLQSDHDLPEPITIGNNVETIG